MVRGNGICFKFKFCLKYIGKCYVWVVFYGVYKKCGNCWGYLRCKREGKRKVIKRKGRLYKDSLECVIKKEFWYRIGGV